MVSVTLPKADSYRRNHLLREASWQAVYDVMREDRSVHVFGEGAQVKAFYDAPTLKADFGDRIHTMPICEDGSTNFCVGAALAGVKPLVDVIGSDFLYRTMDSITNTAAKLETVRSEPHTIVIRAEFLTGGPTTGQRPEALFAHIPGLRVVIPSTPRDAYGLMWTALRSPGVTLFFEDRMIEDGGFFQEDDLVVGKPIPFGTGEYRKFGQRGICTIVTYGVMRQRVEALLAPMVKDGDYYKEPNLDAGIVDLRSIYPVDFALIRYALGRTGRLLIIEPDVTYGGVGAEIAAQIAQEMPHIRIKRLGAPRDTIPADPSLHKRLLPSEQEMRDAIASFD